MIIRSYDYSGYGASTGKVSQNARFGLFSISNGSKNCQKRQWAKRVESCWKCFLSNNCLLGKMTNGVIRPNLI